MSDKSKPSERPSDSDLEVAAQVHGFESWIAACRAGVHNKGPVYDTAKIFARHRTEALLADGVRERYELALVKILNLAEENSQLQRIADAALADTGGTFALGGCCEVRNRLNSGCETGST